MLILTFLKLLSPNLQLAYLILPSPAPKGRNPNATHNVMIIVSIIIRKGRGLRAHPKVNPNRRARLILGQSEKRSKVLLFPTDELLLRGNLTLMSSCDRDCSVTAILVNSLYSMLRGVELYCA